MRIMIPSWEQMEKLTAIPAQWDKFRVTAGETRMAKGIYGHSFCSHFKENGFGIWFSNYLMTQTASFVVSSDAPSLLLYIPLVNPSTILCEALGESKLLTQQFTIFDAPTSPASMAFSGSHHYQVFSIAFTADFLQPYTKHCPSMLALLEKKTKQIPARLPDSPLFLSNDMFTVIQKII